jgi:hypothetical protein
MEFRRFLKVPELRVIVTRLNRQLFFSESDDHRHLDCPRYEKCLNKAIVKNWESFSCVKCPRFKAFLKEKEILAVLERKIEKKRLKQKTDRIGPWSLIYER